MSISKERIDSTKDWLDSWAQSGALPGLMLGIYDENNEELFFHAASSPNIHPATRETPLPYTRDAIFRIYSMTKPVTSVAVMILHERGLLSIYDEVSKYLPEFANIQVISGGDSHENCTTEPLQAPLTIFHLLTHTSGITYGIFGNEVADQVLLKFLGPDAATFMSFTPSAEFSKRAGAAPLAFQPGTKFQYGFSSDVLGVIIEVVSGKSLEEFFQTEIFQPLGMVDSTFFLPIEKQSRVVEVYDIAPGQTCKQNVEMEQVGFSSKKVFQSGGAGLFSTIQDYSKFGNCLLNYGKIRSSSVSENEKRLLKEETVEVDDSESSARQL